jgi:hypothetical protein
MADDSPNRISKKQKPTVDTVGFKKLVPKRGLEPPRGNPH